MKNVFFNGFVDYRKLPVLISKYNVGLLLDKMDDEKSGYHHHNKLYQYMASGTPVVALRYINDYDKIGYGVHLVDSYDEYISVIRSINEGRIKIDAEKIKENVKPHTSEKRAKQFLSLLQTV